MAVTTVSRIQHRRGLKTDLPTNLHEAELGFCIDTRELFVGNSSAVGGNTRVFTDTTDVIGVTNYQFVSNTAIHSQTGASMSQPVIRSLQAQLDDQFANVRSYGAVGDGITDDTAAIQRAIIDLYTKQLPSAQSVLMARKTLWFPSGVYLITSPLMIYPFTAVRGESPHNTQIMLDNTVSSQPCVMQLVDSLGQTDANMGLNGATLPQGVMFSSITITSQQNIDLVWLRRYDDVMFDKCRFVGSWTPGDAVIPGSESVAVRAETLGNAITSTQANFSQCVFSNIELAFYSTDPITLTSFDHCQFRSLFKAILAQKRVAPDPDPNLGPSYTKVSMSSFVDIDDHAIQVMSDNPGVVSVANTFSNVGNTSSVVPVLWSAASTKCVSMADTFDVTPGVSDLGSSNLINNA
jgi:hypothetical protein